jgi:hypothetical protein
MGIAHNDPRPANVVLLAANGGKIPDPGIMEYKQRLVVAHMAAVIDVSYTYFNPCNVFYNEIRHK